ECMAATTTPRMGKDNPHREVAFIDPSVSHLDQLLAGLRADVEAVVLDPTRSAPAQMADALQDRCGLRAVHVIAHGRPGEVSFSSGSLSLATLSHYARDLSRIGEAVDDDGTLLLWSCQTGLGNSGKLLLEALAQTTGVSVAASSGPIGDADLGGNWQLDSAQDMPPPPITDQAAASYAGLLDDTIFGSGADNNSNVSINVIGNSI